MGFESEVEEELPKGYEDSPNREALLLKRGEYIDNAAKQAIKEEGDDLSIDNLIVATRAILEEKQFGNSAPSTEEREEFDKEYSRDVVRGYIKEALETHEKEKNIE